MLGQQIIRGHASPCSAVRPKWQPNLGEAQRAQHATAPIGVDPPLADHGRTNLATEYYFACSRQVKVEPDTNLFRPFSEVVAVRAVAKCCRYESSDLPHVRGRAGSRLCRHGLLEKIQESVELMSKASAHNHRAGMLNSNFDPLRSMSARSTTGATRTDDRPTNSKSHGAPMNCRRKCSHKP
jgi:hypothetical protein